MRAFKITRIDDLCNLHDEYNEAEFDGKLRSITLLIKRQATKDGWYEYKAHKDWTPIRDQLWKASIVLSEGCWEEDSVEGTLLHEMIHQYQCEVLNRAPHHDAVFTQMARRLGRKYECDVE